MKKVLFFIVLIVTNSFAYADNIVVRQAKEAGVKKCLPAIEKVTKAIIGDDNVGSHSIWHVKNVNKHTFSSFTEVNFDDGSSYLVTFDVSHVATGECSVNYKKIFYANDSCMGVSSKALSKFQYQNRLNKSVSILKNNDNSMYAYLQPVGSGCVAVVQEFIADGLKI